MSAEGNVRVALGSALRNQWVASNASGYDPTLAESDANYLDVHLGWYDEDLGFPQLVLSDVSATAQGANGYIGWKPDGSGHVAGYDGRIDVVVFVGSVGDLPETPALLADDIAGEARRIIHANEQGLQDYVTGDQLVDRLAAQSRPVADVNTQAPEARYSSRVEVAYQLYEQPP